MNELLFDVMLGVVIVVSIIITRYLVPYFKASIQETKYAELLDTIEKAVLAAEQTIKASGQGKAKKAQVIAFVTSYLNDKGIKITQQQLDNLIEAAVFTMNNANVEV